jgi:prepilin-type N-terminal cleavage/methylation domain-containing protein
MIKFMRFEERLKCGIRNSEFGISIPQSLPAASRRTRNPQSKGMTFLEVIMVLVIIGILAAIVMPKTNIGMTSSRASVDGAAYMIASDSRYERGAGGFGKGFKYG